MPARRSTRVQKKREVEALTITPENQTDNTGHLMSLGNCDEVDGPAPVPVEKMITKPNEKGFKTRTAKRQEKVPVVHLRRKDDCGQNDSKQNDGVEKEKAIARGKKRKSGREDCAVTDQKRPKQNADQRKKCEGDILSEAPASNSKRQTKKKAHKKEVESAFRSTKIPDKSNDRSVKDTLVPNKSDSSRIKDKLHVSDRVLKSESMDTSHSVTDSQSMSTEDSSSSDSDFEEVSTQYKTPQSYFSSSSSVCADSGICHKFEDDFSINTISTSQDMSVSLSSSDTTSFSSPSCSTNKIDSRTTADGRSKKAATSAAASCSTGRKKASKQIDLEQKSNRPKHHSRQTKPSNLGKKLRKNRADTSHSETKGTAAKSKSDENDVMAILMKMEGQPLKHHRTMTEEKPSTSRQSTGKNMSSKKIAAKKMAKADSSEESDWEEVEDYKHSPVKPQIPDAPVEITIDDPNMLCKKRKKKEFDWKAYVQRKMKRLAREIQVDMHKVHLLCLVSHGMQQNSVCSDVSVCATALSVLPPSHLKTDVAFHDDETLVFLLKWFKSAFCMTISSAEKKHSLVSSSQLMKVIQENTASEPRLLVMVLAAMLRAMGFNVRLVMSLQPLPLKTSLAYLNQTAPKRKKEDATETASTSSKKRKQTAAAQKPTKNVSSTKQKPSKVVSKQTSSGPEAATQSTNKNRKPVKSACKSERKRKSTKMSKSADIELSDSSDDDDCDSSSSVAKRRTSIRPRKPVKPSVKDNSGDSDDDHFSPSSDSDGSNFSEEEEEVRKKKRSNRKGKESSKPAVQEVADTAGKSDEEFDQSFSPKSLLVKAGKQLEKTNRKVLSDESSMEEIVKSKGRDCWLEVYLPRPNKWFCVDCIRCVIGKPFDTSAAASKPLLYILGFENDGSVKDITAKYAPQWLSHTRKQRVDSDWWRESLQPYTSANTVLDVQENREIKDRLVQRPLPTSIGDFKNHPLYALRRHLLKYEAIYPESSVPVGYIRKEPVYARECVHTLHSRENWLREARLVRLGETAYKMVKSRKRWNRARDNPEELDLELFGHWQTEDYISPPAVNGKVPKNEYGNVEMFQPSMLPGGTVHVRVPALNRVAKKLGIDIAAAMTGWDHHCGYSHPVLDGWIVCEEHKDILLAAWEEDQEIQRQREEDRRAKRVLNNWTTLTRGLLIKDKLKRKFNFEETTKVEAKPKKGEKGKKKGEMATDVQHAWPARQQQKNEASKEKSTPVPSHFTVETM